MTLNDAFAFLIAAGYAVGGFILWRHRKVMVGLPEFGWVLAPAIVLWIVFYLFVALADERLSMGCLVWLSRTAHGFGIAFLLLLGAFTRVGDDV